MEESGVFVGGTATAFLGDKENDNSGAAQPSPEKGDHDPAAAPLQATVPLHPHNGSTTNASDLAPPVANKLRDDHHGSDFEDDDDDSDGLEVHRDKRSCGD